MIRVNKIKVAGLRTSTDDLDHLHELVAKRRAGTRFVKVEADTLFALLQDHATMAMAIQENEDGIEHS